MKEKQNDILLPEGVSNTANLEVLFNFNVDIFDKIIDLSCMELQEIISFRFFEDTLSKQNE